MLLLGATLFEAVGIDQVRDVIEKRWFAIPATTVMFAAAIHLTDVRASLIRGIRTVALTLLAWLAPVLTVLTSAFLLALPFTGLEPLWQTRNAAVSLFGAAAALIVLINAAYQDGQPEAALPALLRWAGRLAALLLLPLIGLATYAIWLRVGQYGLSPDRVAAIACTLVGACYALGYAVAALRPGPWLEGLETTNILAGIVMLAALLALFTPVADPARLSVADQLRRLETGAVSAVDFDYGFLRFDGGRYGRTALERMVAQGGDIGEQGARAQQRVSRWPVAEPATPAVRKAGIRAWPEGQALPQSFLDQDWNDPVQWPLLPRCLTRADTCEAFFADLTSDGTSEILLWADGTISAFEQNAGRWAFIGVLEPGGCGGLVEALRSGTYQPAPPRFVDLDVGGQRLRLDILGVSVPWKACDGQ